MRNRIKKIGMDYWVYDGTMKDFLLFVKDLEIDVYEITVSKQQVTFFSPIYQRRILLRNNNRVIYKKTTGMMGFFIRQMKNPVRIISFILCSVIWYVLSNTIFEIQVISDYSTTTNIIEKKLHDLSIQTPIFQFHNTEFKKLLRKELEHDVSWLELTKIGSHLQIHATTKKFVDIEQLGDAELIAQKDGVIVSFDLHHGNKLVGINDKVKKGDVLVTNKLMDSMNHEKNLNVRGKVFAYTWYDIDVEIENKESVNIFHFFQLLMEARREIAKQLGTDEKIITENILQFEQNEGRIKLKTHYVLLEDITLP